MNGDVKRLPNMPELVFISYFKPRLAPEYYQRAKSTFDIIGKYLPVSFATQLYLATRYGKINEVLSAYEWFVGQADSIFKKKPSREKCAELMRQFAGVIYHSVIADQSTMGLEAMVRSAKVPEVFNQMRVRRRSTFRG